MSHPQSSDRSSSWSTNISRADHQAEQQFTENGHAHLDQAESKLVVSPMPSSPVSPVLSLRKPPSIRTATPVSDLGGEELKEANEPWG
ncbi:hypothetical protein BT63DRAFT_424522 [Microthyrium microscopicum]|uniref:Uncharacterized protein n=1 Tax=Microthyrium microscopicum TaxID=703497 RepID=A0A6A6UEJ7_9PEZI|nr:hypothetical protein BT63DRAFT_424522 [Microthyrium microscopicum]